MPKTAPIVVGAVPGAIFSNLQRNLQRQKRINCCRCPSGREGAKEFVRTASSTWVDDVLVTLMAAPVTISYRRRSKVPSIVISPREAWFRAKQRFWVNEEMSREPFGSEEASSTATAGPASLPSRVLLGTVSGVEQLTLGALELTGNVLISVIAGTADVGGASHHGGNRRTAAGIGRELAAVAGGAVSATTRAVASKGDGAITTGRTERNRPKRAMQRTRRGRGARREGEPELSGSSANGEEDRSPHEQAADDTRVARRRRRSGPLGRRGRSQAAA
jgi:hypothetical protein